MWEQEKLVADDPGRALVDKCSRMGGSRVFPFLG